MTTTKTVTAEDYLQNAPPFDPVTEKEDIEVIPKLDTPEVANEKFMHEIVTVLVHDSTDRNATPMVEVSVNGRRKFIPRGVPFPIERKYVERLARAKKTTIVQDLDPRLGEGMNRLRKHHGLDYPFELVDDKNPLGREWLMRVLAEA